MRNLFTDSSSIVEAGLAHSGIASRPQTLQIVNGAAWVTIEGEPHDYWLSTGDALNIRPGRLVVVEAGRTDVAVKVAAAKPSHIWRNPAGMFQRAWRALQLGVKRPVSECADKVGRIGQQICGSQASSSGWRRLGHL